MQQEMFLEIFIPSILEGDMESFKAFKGVESCTLRDDSSINGKTYRFVGYFKPEDLVKKIQKRYQQLFDEHNQLFLGTFKKELKKFKRDKSYKREQTKEDIIEGLKETMKKRAKK